MKYVMITFLIFCAGLLSSFKYGGEGNNKEYSFKSVDDEVAMEVERGRTEVLLHILVKDMSQYDHIIIERSTEGGSYFAKCKYITCAEQKTDNGYFLQIDRYPFSAAKDSYYRIKTVTKDGIERAYPAVPLLAATSPAATPTPAPAAAPATPVATATANEN